MDHYGPIYRRISYLIAVIAFKQVLEVHVRSLSILRVHVSPFQFVAILVEFLLARLCFDLSPF